MKRVRSHVGDRHSGPLSVAAILVLVFSAAVAVAQMPGMSDAKAGGSKPAAAEQPAVVAPAQNSAQQNQGTFARFHQKYLGLDSPYRPLILVVLTLLILMWLKGYLTRKMRVTVSANAYLKENAQGFMKTWNSVWKFVIAILVLIAMSGSFRLLGLTAGFIGMMLGWSLQQPVTGMAAWLMIVLKKPFRIGDRVIIAGITGDVTAISLTHVTLNQVGGSIGGEERSGRGILIPNAILFQNVIINYTLEQKYMLDEVPVRLTFDCDWERAKELMLIAAKEVTVDITKETGQEPFIRAEFLEYGILVRLRYNTIPVRRQEISTNIIEKLIASFHAEYPRVSFAIPQTHIRYQSVEPGQPDEPPPYKRE